MPRVSHRFITVLELSVMTYIMITDNSSMIEVTSFLD